MDDGSDQDQDREAWRHAASIFIIGGSAMGWPAGIWLLLHPR